MASNNRKGNLTVKTDLREANSGARLNANTSDSTFARPSTQDASSNEPQALDVALEKQKLSSKDRKTVSLLRAQAATERWYFFAQQKSLRASLYRFVDVLWELGPDGLSSEISKRLEECREELEQHSDLLFGPASRLEDLEDALRKREHGLGQEEDKMVLLTSEIVNSLNRPSVNLTDEEKAEADSEAAMSRYPPKPPMVLPKKPWHPLLEEYAVRYRELGRLHHDHAKLHPIHEVAREARRYDEEAPEEHLETMRRRKSTELRNEISRCYQEAEAIEVACIEAGIDPGEMRNSKFQGWTGQLSERALPFEQPEHNSTSMPTTSESGSPMRSWSLGDRSPPTAEPSPSHRSEETALRTNLAALENYQLPTDIDRIGEVINIQDIHNSFLNERYPEETAARKVIASLMERDRTLSLEAATTIFDLAIHFRLD